MQIGRYIMRGQNKYFRLSYGGLDFLPSAKGKKHHTLPKIFALTLHTNISHGSALQSTD